MKTLLTIISIIFFIASCNVKADEKAKDEKNYERVKETLEETERKSPTKFLIVHGEKRKNIIGQTVVKGTIKNNAKVATYKDVEVKMSFYSKTGLELEQDHETIYQIISPSMEVKFKSKYFTPIGTDSIAFSIVEAKVKK